MLTIIRGLPGSGKSTLAKQMFQDYGYTHYETDMFFTDDGVYNYDPDKLRIANIWCINSVKAALRLNRDVVVSNVFATMKEIQPYLELYPDADIITVHGNYKSPHNVPQEEIDRLKSIWERYIPHS